MNPRFFGKGIAFPVELAPGRGIATAAFEDKVRQSIWLILSTVPGERVMRPDFGCTIHELLFHPNTPALRGLLVEKVREALITWEPRIDVLDVITEQGFRPNQVLIRVDYRLRANNAFNNIVFPFSLARDGGEEAHA